MTFYINPSLNYSTNATVILLGGSGLVANDTFSIYEANGTTHYDYTAKASQNDASHQFAIATSGTVTENIIQNYHKDRQYR